MSLHTARDLPFKPSVHVVIMPSQLPLDLLATVRGIREDTLVRSMNICQSLSTKLIGLISVYNGRPRPYEYLDSRRGGGACTYVFIIRFKQVLNRAILGSSNAQFGHEINSMTHQCCRWASESHSSSWMSECIINVILRV